MVDIKGVVVNQVETECGQRGVFATLKCLGSHLSRILSIFDLYKLQNKRSKICRLTTSILRVSVKLLL